MANFGKFSKNLAVFRGFLPPALMPSPVCRGTQKVKDPARILLFSENPMWPWQFGNCACEISSSNLRRIIKGGPIASHKIDCVFGLLDAMWAFDLSEGQVSE